MWIQHSEALSAAACSESSVQSNYSFFRHFCLCCWLFRICRGFSSRNTCRPAIYPGQVVWDSCITVFGSLLDVLLQLATCAVTKVFGIKSVNCNFSKRLLFCIMYRLQSSFHWEDATAPHAQDVCWRKPWLTSWCENITMGDVARRAKRHSKICQLYHVLWLVSSYIFKKKLNKWSKPFKYWRILLLA